MGVDCAVGVAHRLGVDYTSAGLAYRHSCWPAGAGRAVGEPDLSSVSLERSGREDGNRVVGYADEAGEGGMFRLILEAKPKESDA